MEANNPETECICPVLTGTCRAHHVVIVPESQETMASSASRRPNSRATTCGLSGLSITMARSSIVSRHDVIPC